MDRIRITLVPVENGTDITAKMREDVHGDVVASLADLFSVTATLAQDSVIRIKAELVEQVQLYLCVSTDSVWVQDGVDSSFRITSNQEWIIL